MRIEWNLTMALVLAWSVLALSLGGIGLYLLMLRRGEVSRIATFLYLVPPLVAVEAWLLFGETLTPVQIAGMAADDSSGSFSRAGNSAARRSAKRRISAFRNSPLCCVATRE